MSMKSNNQGLTSRQYLDNVILHVNTESAMYQCIDSQLFPTSNQDDEYAVIVLKVMNEQLFEFYGGQYIIQQWQRKRKLFQTIHNQIPNHFYLFRQRFMYSLIGLSEESTWLYIVSFYQQIFNKVKHPLFDLKSANESHDLALYVDAKQCMIVNQKKIMWGLLKSDQVGVNASSPGSKQEFSAFSQSANQIQESQGVGSGSFTGHVGSGGSGGFSQQQEQKRFANNVRATQLVVLFKNIQASCKIEGKDEDEEVNFTRFYDIGNEGFDRKEIHVLTDREDKVSVFKINPVKFQDKWMFKLQEKIRFDKASLDIGFNDEIRSMTMVAVSGSENVFMMTKPDGDLKIITENDQQRVFSFKSGLRSTLISERRNRIAMSTKKIEEENELVQDEDEEDLEGEGGIASNDDASIKCKKIYVRRTYLYIEEMNGQLKKLNLSECKLNNPLKRASRESRPSSEVMIQDITQHLSYYSFYIMSNTVLIISHGKLLSIYDFKTEQWNHIFPERSAQQQDDQGNYQRFESYFGMPDDEIISLTLNYQFPNSIYDCFVGYEGNYVRRLKYFNEVNKTFFEKQKMFQGLEVKQIVKNFDMKMLKKFGQNQVRTFFLIGEGHKKFSIWVSENGAKMTKFISNINERVQLLEITNGPKNVLGIIYQDRKKLVFHNFPIVKQELYLAELQQNNQNKLFEVQNFVMNQQTKYFLFKKKLFYSLDGNLMQIKFNKEKQTHVKHEFNFKNNIKEFFMPNEKSIYFKDKKNILHYVKLDLQKQFDLENLPSKVLPCLGSFVKKIDYCVNTNRIILFTSPFTVSIIPNLDKSSIDLMATQDFKRNYLFWKQIDSKLHAFKAPNTMLSWSIETGKVEKQATLKNILFENYQYVNEWNEQVLLKKDKNTKIDEDEKGGVDKMTASVLDSLPQDKKQEEELKLQEKEKILSEEIEQELKPLVDRGQLSIHDAQVEKNQRLQFKKKSIFSVVKIEPEGKLQEICRFGYELREGLKLCVSYPYLLVMDDNCTKQYSLEGDSKFKILKLMNTFYDMQQRISAPTYFSPDLIHRIYQDVDTQRFMLSNNLTHTTIAILPFNKKQIMFQIQKTHPMIYFHDNDKIVVLTKVGVEQMFQIEKHVVGWRKKITFKLKEISNCYFNKDALIRRFIIDQTSSNQQLINNLEPLNILRIKSDITRRALLLNEYLITNTEEFKTNLKNEYRDKNLGDFSNLIVGNFRRQNSFSYIQWKVIEQIAEGKISTIDLKKKFLDELSFVILPNQRTLLHYLGDNYEEMCNYLKILEENQEQMENQQQLDQATAGGFQKKKQLKQPIIFNDVTFLPDQNGLTPLHESIQSNNTRFTDKLMKQLAETDFDHHVRFLIDTFPLLVNNIPDTLSSYFEARQKQNAWVEQYQRGKLKELEDTDFNFATNEMWHPTLDQQLPERLFTGDLDKPLTVKIIDFPNMHKYENQHAKRLIHVLSETTHVEIFENSSIRSMIEIKWPYVQQAMKKYLFYPYLVLLISFLYYSVVIFEQIQQGKAEDKLAGKSADEIGAFDWDITKAQFWIQNQKQLIKLLILVITLYFFSLEFRQIVVQGPIKYLGSIWNMIDIVPITLITTSLLLEYFMDFPQTERAINAISSFALWMKFLYFLRMNRPSSKFISMIVAVMADMKIFNVVLLIGMVSFSQSMYILSNNSHDESSKFIHSFLGSLLFTYEIALGSWETGALGDNDRFLILLLFILSTLFLCVIMLNLLIAVISDVYAAVEEISENELYRNLSDLIVENEYLVKGGDILNHDNGGDYLYIAKLDKTQLQDDSLRMKLVNLQRTVTKRTNVITTTSQQFQKTLNTAIHQSQERFLIKYLEEHTKCDQKMKEEMQKHHNYVENLTDKVEDKLFLQVQNTFNDQMRKNLSKSNISPSARE